MQPGAAVKCNVGICSKCTLLQWSLVVLSLYPPRSPTPLLHPIFSWLVSGWPRLCSAVEESDERETHVCWLGTPGSLLYALRLVWPHSMPPTCPFTSEPRTQPDPYVTHRRSISYDDHLNCSHMPMLTKFMTCIFPPSYFLFLFVCVISIYSFYSSLPSSYVCAYLSPSIFCLSSSPSAKPISSRTLCHIHVYIPFPAFCPHVSRATFLVIKLPASFRSEISQFPFSYSHSTTVPPRLRPWLLQTSGYILVTFCFLIRT